MAPIIPSNEDKENLEEFAKAFCQSHTNTIISTNDPSEDNNNNVIDAYESKLSDNVTAIRNRLAFTSDEVDLLSQICATVLAITAHATRFFTAGSAQESAANLIQPTTTLEGIAHINNNYNNTIRYHNNSSEGDKSAGMSSGIASKEKLESIKLEAASPSPAGVNQEEYEKVKIGEVQSTLNRNSKLFQGSITPFDFLSSSSSSPANVAVTQNERVKQSVESNQLSIWHYGMKKFITRHVPFELLTSCVHEINELHLSLHNALQVLREFNKRHAFIFTVNVMHIKAYVNALCKRRRLKLTPSERAQMHNASDDIIHDHSWKNESNNNNSSVSDNMESSEKESHSFCYSTLSQNNSIDNTKNNNVNYTFIQNTNTTDKTEKQRVQEMNSTNNTNRNIHAEQEQTQLKQMPVTITTDQTNSIVSLNQTHSDNPMESDLTHIDSQMLSVLHKEEIPSFYVQQSYAVFIGWCQVLMEWTTQLLAIIYRSDGIPEPGTFILPPSPAEAAIALPSSLTTLMNVSKKQSANNVTTSSNEHNNKTTTEINHNTTPHRSRVVSVQRYQTYNVQQFYDLLMEQSQRTLDLKSTVYDAELQLMCINPSCIDTLKDVINECSMYITRLEDVEAGRLSADFIDPYFFPYEAYGSNTSVSADSYSAAHSNSTSVDNNAISNANNYLSHCKVVFIPSLSSFRLLRAMLRLYLSVSINAQEQTAVHLFEQRYRDVSMEVREMTRHLSSLPIPPKVRASEQFENDNNNAHKAHAIKEVAYANQLNKHSELEQQEEVSELEQDKRKTWEPTASERKQLNEYFEQYWTIRDKVNALMCELRKDIKCKNKTHCVRVMGRYVANENDEFAQKAEKWYQRHQAELNKNNISINSSSSSSSSWLWRKVCDVGSALVSTITCQAEVYPTDMYDNRIDKNNICGNDNNVNTNSISSGKVDDMSMPLSLYSPQYALKEMLYVDVKQLWQAIEVQGAQLEKIYIGRFHRSEKDKWLHYAEQCMRQVNKVSVVFDA